MVRRSYLPRWNARAIPDSHGIIHIGAQEVRCISYISVRDRCERDGHVWSLPPRMVAEHFGCTETCAVAIFLPVRGGRPPWLAFSGMSLRRQSQRDTMSYELGQISLLAGQSRCAENLARRWSCWRAGVAAALWRGWRVGSADLGVLEGRGHHGRAMDHREHSGRWRGRFVRQYRADRRATCRLAVVDHPVMRRHPHQEFLHFQGSGVT